MKSIERPLYLSRFPTPQPDGEREPKLRANGLPEIRKQLKYCLESQPHQYMVIEKFETVGGQAKNTVKAHLPLEHLMFIANCETSFRANAEKGLNPGRHEPIETIQALETVLPQGIPSVIQKNPSPLMESAAQTYSERLFSILLASGLQPDTQKTLAMLDALWQKSLKHALSTIQDTQKYQQYQANGNLEDMPTSSATLPDLQATWPLDGLRDYNARILSNLKRMGISVRIYEKVHQFIERLRERIAETRHKKFLAELETEMEPTKKMSKSAKRKAKLKVRIQTATPQPPVGGEASSSGRDQSAAVRQKTPNRTVRTSSPPLSLPASPERSAVESSPRKILPNPVQKTRTEIRCADPTIRELRKRVARLLPASHDRETLRNRVETLKIRLERLEARITEIQSEYDSV